MVDLSVLPDADEVVRCSDFARGLQVDPGGNAIRADLLIAAETPLPWPKPVFDHDLLGDVPALVAAAPAPTRILAAVPGSDDSLSVVAYRRIGGGAARSEWLTDSNGLASTLAAVIEGQTPTQADPAPTPDHAAEIWICTQGSHDMCCGADGTRLVNDVAGRWTDVVTRRVSHTGGHRFAPTGITLPDGRMWAYLDPEGLHGIITRSGDPRLLSERCRGWWGAEAGASQVAERALLSLEGWAWETAPRETEVLGVDDGVTTVRVSAGEGPSRSWVARVRVSRDIPTIACRAPGGLPAKPGVEYELVDIVPE